jgi:hypothetical protein
MAKLLILITKTNKIPKINLFKNILSPHICVIICNKSLIGYRLPNNQPIQPNINLFSLKNFSQLEKY